MLRATGLLGVLALMWWLWSGYATALLLSFGLISCLLVLWIALRMDVVDREATPLHLTLSAPLYWLWLSKEILRSNIDTCQRILQPGSKVEPVVVDVLADQSTDLGKVIFANSVTLTPGTLSMLLDDQHLQVHALHQSAIDDINTGAMSKRVKKLE